MNRYRKSLFVGIGAVVALVGLTACGDDGSTVAQTGRSQAELAAASPSSDILPELTPKADLPVAPSDEVHATYAPEVPPPSEANEQRIFDIELEVLEADCPIDPASGARTEVWGYRIAGDDDVRCGAPGPVLRGRVGDVARITVTNLAANRQPHNIDFHSVTGAGGGAAALTVGPGETATIEVRLLYPGAFMYHCAFGDVPEHIAHGMVGMFIVDPAQPLPEVDHEWAIMQSEWYLDGAGALDRAALSAEEPKFVTFNGRTDALVGDNALHMKVGDRARIYFVNEGLNLDANFHPIGSHWDTVYPEAATHPLNDPIRGSQTTLVVAGGGTVTELVGVVPSTIILVDHALVRTFYKGAIGQVVVEGDPAPEVFTADADAPVDDPNHGAPPADSGDAVRITAGAFDPGNADRAFFPATMNVPVGTTITWTNEDSVAHTVTSGTVDGFETSPDGIFDSGDLAAGDTFSHTFTEEGEFTYYCTPHPWMQGTVRVQG